MLFKTVDTTAIYFVTELFVSLGWQLGTTAHLDVGRRLIPPLL
jgi:hypothetical protein